MKRITQNKKTGNKMTKQTLNLLFSLGFKHGNGANIFTHKMFENGTFDFSKTSNDIFWIMAKIFDTCKTAGESIKAEKIRKELFI